MLFLDLLAVATCIIVAILMALWIMGRIGKD